MNNLEVMFEMGKLNAGTDEVEGVRPFGSRISHQLFVCFQKVMVQ